MGEAGDFTSLIGIPLQSPVLQQAGAFLLGRHHQHIKGQRPDPPLNDQGGEGLVRRRRLPGPTDALGAAEAPDR